MKLFIIVLSNFLTLIAALPYIRAILKGTTKPRVASWFGWGALALVGAASSFSQHQVPAGIFLSFCSLQNFSVVVLGLKHGDRRLTTPDIICLIGAFIGGATLVVLRSPVLSTAVAIATDIIVWVPTLIHSWQEPGEETAAAYILEGMGCVLTLTVAGSFTFTAIAYPLYLLIADEILAVLILKGHRRLRPEAVGATSTTAIGPTPASAPRPGTQVLPQAHQNIDELPKQ